MQNYMEITAIILAGGQGRRFAYQDKGLIQWRGRSLVSHVIERIRPQVSNIIISCNQHLDEYQRLGYPIVPDDGSSFRGPLAGISAGLAKCETPFALVSPCDSPLLPADLSDRLSAPFHNREDAQQKPPDASLAFDGQRAQYLCALFDVGIAQQLRTFLKASSQDETSAAVKDWYSSLNTVTVDFSDQTQAFKNFNRPEDLEQ